MPFTHTAPEEFMSTKILDAASVRSALSVRDLTDEAQGPHALQHLIHDVLHALRTVWQCDLIVERQSPIVSVADNYDRLHYPPDGAARDARYTRYVCESAVLRTQTSAMIPPALRRMAGSPPPDVLLACPGVVYRRDSIDRLHTGEPHQLDLWRIARRPLTTGDLQQMIAIVVTALLPSREHRAVPAEHPYTLEGLQIDVREGDAWIEIGECGRALPALLEENGHPPPASGLAMGLGLDRILMLRKGLDDIRRLRSTEPRVAAQMLDVTPYRPVSTMPAVQRDLSLVVAGDANAEQLGDGVRAALGDRSEVIESIEVLSETRYEALPPSAVQRLGIHRGQKNVLVRVVLRALDRSLTHAECNQLRDEIYAALHEGTAWEWATSARPRTPA
jgi:phenylalanyl-tRNA synthetase alpha chain